MTLEQIKASVDAGETVCWRNNGYRVTKDNLGKYSVTFYYNKSSIGLTWKDGKTLNGRLSDFYIKEK